MSSRISAKKPVGEDGPVKALQASGGAEEIRTPDPHNAIVVLYQLSYDPTGPKAARTLGIPVELSKYFYEILSKLRQPSSPRNPPTRPFSSSEPLNIPAKQQKNLDLTTSL